MSAPMKILPIKNGIRVQVGERKIRLFLVPKDRAHSVIRLLQDFEIKENQQVVPWKEPIADLVQKYTEAGVALRGARVKENLSQSDLARKLGIPQSHISDMEHGRRTIGKNMARRLSNVLHVGYKIFL